MVLKCKLVYLLDTDVFDSLIDAERLRLASSCFFSLASFWRRANNLA